MMAQRGKMPETLVVFNGINGSTGNYLIPPMTLRELSAYIQKENLATKNPLSVLSLKKERDEAGRLGVQDDVDPLSLAQAGWGVIFPAQLDSATLKALKTALHPLLNLRKRQAGERYYEYEGSDGYQPDDTILEWLPRHGMGPGEEGNPAVVPYYLLLVGSPEMIPFSFQYQLDVNYAVGRLYFEPLNGESFTETLPRYALYGQSVASTEDDKPFLRRRITLFGVANDDDQSTQSSHRSLIVPLANELSQKYGDWDMKVIAKEEATKSQLIHLLGYKEAPSLLFTASHGVGFELGDPKQLRHQGALLCHDWPGPVVWSLERKGIPEHFYLSADDVSDTARLLGTIIFHFSCYGAGTPRFSDSSHIIPPTNKEVIPKDIVAYLPQRLLSHPNGSALAVIGHVDQVYGYSFRWEQAGKQTGAFRDTMSRLMRGERVGWATEPLNRRYAALSTSLSSILQQIRFGRIADDENLAGIWTANNDARNYVILGDPAVKLPLE